MQDVNKQTNKENDEDWKKVDERPLKNFRPIPQMSVGNFGKVIFRWKVR